MLNNNYPADAVFSIFEKKQTLPFYKGHYQYYWGNYGCAGPARLSHKRIYITVASQGQQGSIP